MSQTFETVSLEKMEEANEAALDLLPFGVVGFMSDYIVTFFNASESKAAGLSPSRVVGKHFFHEVAPCMNNFMVAQRFEDEQNLDDIIPYVLTLRMRPTPVRLRLMKSNESAKQFLLVERKVQ
ncbi:Photoactive yellow protein (plasmid) [Caballeronia sp. SBC1]|uniref:phosphonate transporter n=1 Tax=unclassified Caballeronia TaxID=2646786 RepID=UPI0013E208E6|nr:MULTISPECIES: phosphonate transporter [unclassified Caballeronia]QIE29469.1 Photoactive yellow protein [Caballeronia sp. SBC2]QIN67101.1 Photoactive yellow protein [Caballeronia sp. SBC1]